jgi:hypothetical protein
MVFVNFDFDEKLLSGWDPLSISASTLIRQPQCYIKMGSSNPTSGTGWHARPSLGWQPQQNRSPPPHAPPNPPDSSGDRRLH